MSSDKWTAKVQALAKKKPNNCCFVCAVPGANYAVITPELGAFVCATCGGLMCVPHDVLHEGRRVCAVPRRAEHPG